MSDLERRTHDEAGNKYGELKPTSPISSSRLAKESFNTTATIKSVKHGEPSKPNDDDSSRLGDEHNPDDDGWCQNEGCMWNLLAGFAPPCPIKLPRRPETLGEAEDMLYEQAKELNRHKRVEYKGVLYGIGALAIAPVQATEIPVPWNKGQETSSNGASPQGDKVPMSSPNPDSEGELEAATQEWIDKNVDSTLGFINWTNGHKSLTDFVHRREDERVVKVLEELKEHAYVGDTDVPAVGLGWVEAAIEQHRTKQ